MVTINEGLCAKSDCGMYMPLSDDKHRFVRDSSLCTLEIQDNFFFRQKNLFLGLDFVSDYIPQLYFVCNHLITIHY